MIGDGRSPRRATRCVPARRARRSTTTTRRGAPSRRRRTRARLAARRRHRGRRASGRVLPRCRLPTGPKPSVSSRSARLASGCGGERAHAVEPLERVLGGDLRVLGQERRVVDGRDDEAMRSPSGSSKPTLASSRRRAVATRSRAGSPRSRATHRSRRATPTVCTIPAPARPRRTPGYSKKVMSAPGRPGLVGVEEVVDGRVVLVHRLLHEPEAENACVEVDVSRRVGGDARHVVDAVEAHACPA